MAHHQYDPSDLRAAPAAADLSAKQFFGVIFGSGGTIALPGAAGVKIDGVLIDDPKQGQQGSYLVEGVVKVVAGAAITRGAEIMVDNGGKFITAATTGNHIVGKALEAAAADGNVITAEIGYRGVVPA